MNEKQAQKEAARLISEHTNQGAKAAYEAEAGGSVVAEALEPLSDRVTQLEAANTSAEVERLISEHSPRLRRYEAPDGG